MLNALDQYLTDQGFTPFVRAGLQQRPETWHDIPDPNPGFYSSAQAYPGAAYYLRRKWRRGDVEVITGLNEHGMPPTLIWPRPRIRGSVIERNGVKWMESNDRDAVISGLIQSLGPAKVLEAAFDTTIVLEC